MYTLEFYDEVRDIEKQYNFTHPISPQQALDIFNERGIEIEGDYFIELADEFNQELPLF